MHTVPAETRRAFDSIHGVGIGTAKTFMKVIDKAFEMLWIGQEKSCGEVREIDRFSDQLMSGSKTPDEVFSDLQEQARKL